MNFTIQDKDDPEDETEEEFGVEEIKKKIVKRVNRKRRTTRVRTDEDVKNKRGRTASVAKHKSASSSSVDLGQKNIEVRLDQMSKELKVDLAIVSRKLKDTKRELIQLIASKGRPVKTDDKIGTN